MTSDETASSDQGEQTTGAAAVDHDDAPTGSGETAESDPSDDVPDPQTDPDSPGATIDDPEPAEPNEPG